MICLYKDLNQIASASILLGIKTLITYDNKETLNRHRPIHRKIKINLK